MEKRRIVDRRVKEKFLMDDAYLNGWARKCGWKATLVYLALCRHASKDQECFPSVKLMQEELDVSRDTVIRGLQSLEDHGIISIEKRRGVGGTWISNVYVLHDKSVWNPRWHQVAHSDVVINPNQVAHSVHPSRSQLLSQVAHSDTKETQLEGNTLKETHSAAQGAAGDAIGVQVNELLELFRPVNPTVNRLFANRTQRKALERLLVQFGESKLRNVIATLSTAAADRYGPTITTPVELEAKLGQLAAFIGRRQPRQIVSV